MVARLIVPLDRSSIAESALPLARGLARQYHLPVTLVSVIDVPEDIARDGDTGENTTLAAERIAPLAEQSAEDEQYLNRVADTFKVQAVETIVQYGNPAEQILHIADVRENPVIVMASHGRSGLQRVLIGSVTLRIVQTAVCPVFVVRGQAGEESSQGSVTVEYVLAPLDGSAVEEHVLAALRRVTGDSTPRLHLLRVVETAPARGEYPEEIGPEYKAPARARAEEYLTRVTARLKRAGYTVTWEVREGRVAEQINLAAVDASVDLIVMATHGHSGINRFFLGSVAEDVVQDATRPLMLLRPIELES